MVGFIPRIRLKVVSADQCGLINELNTAGIELLSISVLDELTAEFVISYRDYRCVSKLLERRGDAVKDCVHIGLAWQIFSLFKRPVILSLGMLCVLLTLIVPTRILFIDVRGCDEMNKVEITALAQECGIYFGARSSEIRSEKIKNKLMSLCPEIQWLGVNIKGCVAGITVNMDDSIQTLEDNKTNLGMYALRDGVVRSVTVTSGTPLCVVGEAVKEGQLLISPYRDDGVMIKSGYTTGEIYADTFHSIKVAVPLKYTALTGKIRIKKKYSIKIGKKFIKFYKDSRILDTGCVKMYHEKGLCLGKGFELPISLLVCEEIHYEGANNNLGEMQALASAKDMARRYLYQQMYAGTIYRENFESDCTGDTLSLFAQFACCEMIAQAHYEELEFTYGKRD